MNCPWKNNNGCASKCGLTIAMFALSVLAVSVLIKIIAWILCIFSCDMYLNSAIATVATVIVLAAYCKCPIHKNLNSCCDEDKTTQDDQTSSSE